MYLLVGFAGFLFVVQCRPMWERTAAHLSTDANCSLVLGHHCEGLRAFYLLFLQDRSDC